MVKKKKSYKRHRKMGAFNPGSPLVMGLAVAAGYFLGDTINAAIDKVLPASLSTGTGVMAYIPTAAEAGIGAMLLLGKKKSLVKAAAGGILAGAGLRRGLKKAGVVSGYQSVPVIGRRSVRGYQSVPVIGGIPSSLTGLPNGNLPDYGVNTPAALGNYQVNGYRPNGSRVIGGLSKNMQYAGGASAGSGITADGTGYMN